MITKMLPACWSIFEKIQKSISTKENIAVFLAVYLSLFLELFYYGDFQMNIREENRIMDLPMPFIQFLQLSPYGQFYVIYGPSHARLF